MYQEKHKTMCDSPYDFFYLSFILWSGDFPDTYLLRSSFEGKRPKVSE